MPIPALSDINDATNDSVAKKKVLNYLKNYSFIWF